MARAVTAPPQQAAVAFCSFCRKPDTEVNRLVAGPGVYICDGCVALCQELVKGERRARPRVAPWEHDLGADEVLAWLPQVAAAAGQVEEDLTQWVGKARAVGVTWARIGEALGMTRQSAWERFSGEG